jgi:predicted nucleic acid-binding Zn ribbon protein
VPVEGDHRHCKVCGKVTKPSSETCSEACAAERQRRRGTANNYRYLLYGTLAFLVLLLLSSFLHL